MVQGGTLALVHSHGISEDKGEGGPGVGLALKHVVRGVAACDVAQAASVTHAHNDGGQVASPILEGMDRCNAAISSSFDTSMFSRTMTSAPMAT